MSSRPNVHGGRAGAAIPGEWSGIALDDTPSEPAESPLKTVPVHELGPAGYDMRPGDPLAAQRPEDQKAQVAATLAAGADRPPRR